jgi:hypothetical protein
MIIPLKIALLSAPLVAAGYWLWWKPTHAAVAPAPYAPPPPAPLPGPAPGPAPSVLPGQTLQQVDPLAPPGGYTPGGYNPWINNEPTYQNPTSDPGPAPGGGYSPPSEYDPASGQETPLQAPLTQVETTDPGILGDLGALGYDADPSNWFSGTNPRIGAASPTLLRSLTRRRALKDKIRRLGL